MDYTTFLLLLSFFLTFFYLLTTSGRRSSRLPPGPYPFPIIGNLLKLGDLPHHSLTKLYKHYGPLMSLKLGCRTTIVVSSPDIAKEFFLTHDQSFSGRSVPETVRFVDHTNFSIVWSPADDQWRKLRRIAKEYLFSIQRLDGSKPLREEKGSCYNEAEADYYGLLDEVLEVEYVGVGRCVVVLFKCTWFDVNQGVRVDKKHDLVSVKYKSRLNTDDPFILASQAQQVYYTSYPSQTKELKDWWAVIKTKPRGIYEVAGCANEVDDDDNVDGEHFFQLDERVHSTLSTSTNDGLESVPLVTPGAFVEVGSADGVDDDEEEHCQDTETDSDAPNKNDVYLSNESSDE